MLTVRKETLITIFWVFGVTQPGIEPRFPGPLANALRTPILLKSGGQDITLNYIW